MKQVKKSNQLRKKDKHNMKTVVDMFLCGPIEAIGGKQ